MLVLEDDPYGLVRFEGDALPSLYELSGGEIAYSSSFSKTVAPGLRVGWFVLPEELARESRRPRPRPTSRRSCSGRRPCTSSSPRALRAEPRARDRPVAGAARRDARGARPRPARRAGDAACRGLLRVARARRCTTRPSCCRAPRRRRHLRPGPDFGGGRDTLRLAYSFVSPERSPRASPGWRRRCRRTKV